MVFARDVMGPCVWEPEREPFACLAQTLLSSYCWGWVQEPLVGSLHVVGDQASTCTETMPFQANGWGCKDMVQR